MRQPIFERKSKRSWTNALGQGSEAVRLRIYEPSRFTGPAPFDAYIGAPSGYVVLKSIEDLKELRGFLDEAIEAYEKHTLMPVETKLKKRR